MAEKRGRGDAPDARVRALTAELDEIASKRVERLTIRELQRLAEVALELFKARGGDEALTICPNPDCSKIFRRTRSNNEYCCTPCRMHAYHLNSKETLKRAKAAGLDKARGQRSGRAKIGAL